MSAEGEKDNLHLPSTFEDAERFQRLFVKPMVDCVKKEMRATCEQLKAEFAADRKEQEQLRTDVDSLKSNQRKALIGWGVIATGVSVFIGFCGDWVKRKIGLS